MDTLNTLLQQAEAERNLALAAFNQARARSEAARCQAGELEAYRQEYQQRWGAQFTRGAALEIVRCYQAFSGRLDGAIAQQGHTVALAAAGQERAADALTAHELRVASVRKLIQRRLASQRQLADRREQKASDESAMRMALRRSRANPNTDEVTL